MRYSGLSRSIVNLGRGPNATKRERSISEGLKATNVSLAYPSRRGSFSRLRFGLVCLRALRRVAITPAPAAFAA